MIAKITIMSGAAVAVAAALAWNALFGGEPTPAVELPPFEPAVSQRIQYRGLAIQIRDGLVPLEKYGPLLPEIANLGANTVLFSVAGYMEHARSQAIFIDARETPSHRDLATLIKQAHHLGLNVIVMPIVLLKHPRGSEWRGVIQPPDWKEWWRSYRDFLSYFAAVAHKNRAELFTVGSELVSTEKYTGEWIKTIELVRKWFPNGRVGYSANWDHYKPIQFWDKLDFIGMTSYYTLADRKGATVDQIVKRWKPYQREITEWQRRIGKPLIMTEVGWCSQEGAATAPWNYYQSSSATPAGHEEQRRLYEAFLRVWDNDPALQGVIWWEWPPAPGGPSDYGYTPKNKPAEQVLRRWFSAGKSADSGRVAAPP